MRPDTTMEMRSRCHCSKRRRFLFCYERTRNTVATANGSNNTTLFWRVGRSIWYLTRYTRPVSSSASMRFQVRPTKRHLQSNRPSVFRRQASSPETLHMPRPLLNSPTQSTTMRWALMVIPPLLARILRTTTALQRHGTPSSPLSLTCYLV